MSSPRPVLLEETSHNSTPRARSAPIRWNAPGPNRQRDARSRSLPTSSFDRRLSGPQMKELLCIMDDLKYAHPLPATPRVGIRGGALRLSVEMQLARARLPHSPRGGCHRATTVAAGTHAHAASGPMCAAAHARLRCTRVGVGACPSQLAVVVVIGLPGRQGHGCQGGG